LGKFCEISFAPTVTSCYQVHADAHLSAALLCNLGATSAETSLMLTAYCIEWSSPYPRCTLVIVVAWHCYGYTTITKCP